MIILVYLLVILLTFGGGGLLGYQHGKKIERAEWLAKEQKQLAELSKELGEAIERKSAFESAQQNNLMKVINEKTKTIDQLNTDLAGAHRLRIRAENPACPQNPMRGKNENPRQHAESPGESGIRIAGGIREEILSTEEIINREIWRVYEEREKLKAYAKSLRDELVPKVEVVE
ncbi:MAG: hypothetical protein LV471_11165 [Nitrosomonas sp.]|nr:hypothetical protein [Nitrosomonas sp.]